MMLYSKVCNKYSIELGVGEKGNIGKSVLKQLYLFCFTYCSLSLLVCNNVFFYM